MEIEGQRLEKELLGGVHLQNDILGGSFLSMMDKCNFMDQFIPDFDMEDDIDYYNKNFIFIAQPEGETDQKLDNSQGQKPSQTCSQNKKIDHRQDNNNKDFKEYLDLKCSQHLLNQSQNSLSFSKQFSETDCSAHYAEWKNSGQNSNMTFEQAKKYCEEKISSSKDSNVNTDSQLVFKALEEKHIGFGEKQHNSHMSIVNPLQSFYFLSGDVCIMQSFHSKDSTSFNRFSELNTFKTPVKTYTNLAKASLEVELNNKSTGLSDFRFIIDRLKTLSSQQSYNFACLLEKYQVQVNDLKAKKALLADEQTTENYIMYLQKSFSDFQNQSNIFLEKLAQTTTFYTYTYYRLNLMSFEMQMCKFGYSEAFLALLGLDYNLAQHYIWRRGLFDYLDRNNIGTLLYSLIAAQIGGCGDPSKEYDITLHTFDNLDVYAKASNRVFLNNQPNSPFLPYNEILYVSVIDISPSMITQVMEIRKLTKQNNLKYMREMEEDLQYSMEATTFLDKYYQNKTDGFLPSNKRAGYKVIKKAQIEVEVGSNNATK